MAALNFYKVTSLPGTLQANSVYFVLNGTYAETYVTDSAGVGKAVGNSAMINTLAAGAGGGASEIEVVATITARNALTLTKNTMVLVTNAIGDATVAAGAALYVWVQATTGYTKIAEYESMDVSLTWASLQNKPTSSVAAIDAAVTASHSHTNKAFLDKVGETGGLMTYNGAAVSTQWVTTDW